MSSYFEPGAPAWLTAGTTSVPIVIPNDVTAGPLAVTSGLANVYGAWATVTAASTLAAHMLIGIGWAFDGAGNNGVLDIGTGAAGSEAVIGSWPQFNESTAGLSPYYPVIPFLTIPANARVAARLVSNAGGQVARVMCVFLPRPPA